MRRSEGGVKAECGLARRARSDQGATCELPHAGWGRSPANLAPSEAPLLAYLKEKFSGIYRL